MNVRIRDDVDYQVPHIIPAKKKPVYTLVKRAFDLVMSTIGMIVLAVPMLIIAILIRLDSEGPAIFKQERLGLNGKPFYIYKFRSMYIDAEKNGAQWATKDDDRATRIGSILRKTRMDEFPQLVNIFRGQMSIVGPRPERACFYKEFESYIDGFEQRLKVVPGLTGWAQINGGYDLLPEEKIVYDMEYIENRSLRMDWKCICKTFSVISTGDGAR